MVDVSLHLAYDAKINSREIWRAIEDQCLKVFHHLTLLQKCQLEWATRELKPKQTTARFNTMLMKPVLEAIDTASVEELMYIMQGFRRKRNKDLY